MHGGTTAPTMQPMNRFALLLERHPLVFFHLVAALGALALGIVILTRRKGTGSHRALGWAWVLLMTTAALTAAFIRDYRLPNIGGFTPIHLFVLATFWYLPRAVWHARHGRIAAHRSDMRSLFAGACVLAGLFALLPGRFLGNLLWRDTLALIA
jgi:uncharacterized membrane protein